MRKWTITADDYDDSNPPLKKRYGARAVIIKEGLVCLLHTKKFNHYTLPGGGIEENEEKEEALRREVLEETGFEVKISVPVLELEERFNDSIWVNTFYFTTINDKMHNVQLTQEEIEQGLTLKWMPIDDALTLLSEHVGDHPHSEAIMNREFLGLLEALNMYPVHP
jgi:8-oxo-dGTP pyrophosphatase MutT (NUDIX family)